MQHRFQDTPIAHRHKRKRSTNYSHITLSTSRSVLPPFPRTARHNTHKPPVVIPCIRSKLSRDIDWLAAWLGFFCRTGYTAAEGPAHDTYACSGPEHQAAAQMPWQGCSQPSCAAAAGTDFDISLYSFHRRTRPHTPRLLTSPPRAVWPHHPDPHTTNTQTPFFSHPASDLSGKQSQARQALLNLSGPLQYYLLRSEVHTACEGQGGRRGVKGVQAKVRPRQNAPTPSSAARTLRQKSPPSRSLSLEAGNRSGSRG